MSRFIKFSNSLMALVLMGILASAYYQQFFKHELPCPLCILQRLGMIGVAVGNLMNLKFGIHPRHYGISLFSAIFGASVSLRQIALHICPGSPIFGIPVWGYNLYTWAFLAFAVSILALSIMLLLYSNHHESNPLPMNWFDHLAMAVVFILTLSNFVTTFMECGLGPCQDVPWPQP